MVEPQFEVFHIAKAVGLPFEGFDLVVEPLSCGIADPVLEVIEKPRAIARQSLCELGELLDSVLSGILTPSLKEVTGAL